MSCPPSYTCRSHTSATEGFCCRTGSLSLPASVNDGCPPGNFLHMVNGEVAHCDPFNPPNAPCPAGYTCQWSLSNQRYQCCGSYPAPPLIRINDGCPQAQIAYRDGEVVRICSAGASNCRNFNNRIAFSQRFLSATGYFCQFSNLNNQFQCCGVSGGCPDDAVAFIGLSGEPEKCVVGQSNCPTGFACQRSIAGHHVCCSVKMSRRGSGVIFENNFYFSSVCG